MGSNPNLADDVAAIRRTEQALAEFFSVKRPFSEHLARWEDNALPDKYDHNCFEYSAQPTREEFERALSHQRERGDAFIELEGDVPLQDSFGLSPNVTLTMQLFGDADAWDENSEIVIRKPRLEDLKCLELKHFGSVYGESFTLRNAEHLYERLEFRGAYLGDELVGSHYLFTSGGCTCLDGLVVDEGHRHRKIATTLLKHAVREAAGTVVFLHADEDDTPKEMYEQLGFRTVDRLYEYLSTSI